MVKLLLIALTAFALAAALFAWLFSARLIFQPWPWTEQDEAARRVSPLAPTEVFFHAKDGSSLCAWYFEVPNAKATILFLHGNAGHLAHRVDYAIALQQLPASVLLLDYRGYGKSQGAPSEEGVYQDAEAAYEWLRMHGVPAEQIVIYGESLGGAVAIELAARKPAAALILQATFSSIGDMARRVIPLIPLSWAIPTKFDSVTKIASLAIPKLHFHGLPDEVVPHTLGKRLFEAAASPKRWVEYPDIRHNEWPGKREKEWLEEVRRFLAEHVRDFR